MAEIILRSGAAKDLSRFLVLEFWEQGSLCVALCSELDTNYLYEWLQILGIRTNSYKSFVRYSE